MAFHVGQKVVCVDARGATPFLQQDEIYTVTDFNCDPACMGLDCPPANDDPGNRQWFKRRFRPVIERKTDIAIFTAMLTPNKVNA